MSSGKLPSTSVVRLPGGPLQPRPDLTLAEWALLCRVDGRRPLTVLANRSGRGHREALALVERLLAAGVLELAGNAEGGSPPPAGTPETEPADGPELAAEGEAAAELAGLAAPADDGTDDDGTDDDAGSSMLTELAGLVAPGEATAGEAAAPDEDGGGAGEDRIDPVSLLRELAAGAALPAAAAPGPDGQDLEETAAPAASGGEEESGRPPGRGADQAAVMREFASLATGGGEARDDPGPPVPQPDDEPADDDRRGRFGFRRGQRR